MPTKLGSELYRLTRNTERMTYLRNLHLLLLLFLPLTIPAIWFAGPYQTALAQSDFPLSARYSDKHGSPQYPNGATSAGWIAITFNQPVAPFNSDTPSVAVEGGTIGYFSSTDVGDSNVDTGVHYLFGIEFLADGPATFTLRPNQSCDVGGICTVGGTMLTEVPKPLMIPPSREVSFDAPTHGVSRGIPTQVTVSLSEQSDREVIIPLIVTYGDGVSSGDFSDIPPNLTFPPNQSRLTFPVALTDDGPNRGRGTVEISFGNLPPGINAGAQARTRIVLRGDEVWHAMMTVGKHEDALGYSTLTGTTTGALTDSDFVWRDRTYTVNSVLLHQDGTMGIDFTPAITDQMDSLYLVLGNMRLNLADGQESESQFSWVDVSLDWDIDASVPMVLHTFKDSMSVRAIDGRANSPESINRGRAGTAFMRVAPVSYVDRVSGVASTLPGAREVSNAVSAQTQPVFNTAKASDFVWQWGQFLDHDITLTPLADPAETMDIAVPAADPVFDPESNGGVTLAFSRSAFEPTTGSGIGNPREQLNGITAFIDASQQYGSDVQRTQALRVNDGSGKLRTSDEGSLLMYNTIGLENDGGNDRTDLFVSGDIRANEQVGLTAMHTLFVREHNRLADEIARDQPELNGEEIFQMARKRVGAMMQVITYGEFLPVLLGPDFIDAYGGYDPAVDPSISNEFATAAFRVGHTMLPSDLLRVSESGQEITVQLTTAFFNPSLIEEVGIAEFLRGLAIQVAREVDLELVDEVRNLLFRGSRGPGTDLAALNIQRGRDHGIGNYNSVRLSYGLPAVATFTEVTSDNEARDGLSQIYGSVGNLDLWVGGLAEDHVEGAMVGETFHAIIADQFQRLRDGDRFWYENDPYFADNPDLLAQMRETTLSAIIRRNSAIADQFFPNDVFRVRWADLDHVGDDKQIVEIVRPRE